MIVRLSRAGIRRATGRTLAAPLSGQRCITRAAFDAARPLARGFGVETAMTIDMLRAGFRVLEVPTKMNHASPEATCAPTCTASVSSETWPSRLPPA